MRVTRDTLREMILAELAAMEEQGGLVGRSEPRGIPGTPPEMLKLKAGGLSSKMRDFIDALVDAGWEEDSLRAALANMDNDVLASILGPALRESASVTSADILRILREAVAWSEAEEQDANLFWDAWKSVGMRPRDYGTQEAVLDAWIAADRPIPVATWLAQPETQQVLRDLGYVMSQAMMAALNVELQPVVGPDPTLLSEPEAAGGPQFPEDWKPRTRDIHESVLMTVGQFRRLVREAAAAADRNPDVEDVLTALLAREDILGPWDIIDGLNDEVYTDGSFNAWLDRYQAAVGTGRHQGPAGSKSDVQRDQERKMLDDWLAYIGDDEAFDDLVMLQRAWTRQESDDEHPAADQYREENWRSDRLEGLKQAVEAIPADHPKRTTLLVQLDMLGDKVGWEKDDAMTDLENTLDTLSLLESTVITLGQFRKLIREASYDWDPFDPEDRRRVARQLVIDTMPGGYSLEKWEELLAEYISATTWGQGPPESLPTTDMMTNFEDAAAAAAEGLVNPDILKTAILNMISGR